MRQVLVVDDEPHIFAPQPEILGAASDELRRLRRLADDLSTLSRAEEQRLDLNPADTVHLGRHAAPAAPASA